MKNLTPETDVGQVELAMLALMVAEDVQDEPVLLPGLHALAELRQQAGQWVNAEAEGGRWRVGRRRTVSSGRGRGLTRVEGRGSHGGAAA